MELNKKLLDEAIKLNVIAAINEDIKQNDKTSALTSPELNGIAIVRANQKGILCGVPWFENTYKLIDPKVKLKWMVNEGDTFKKNQQICKVYGKFNLLLAGERVALNFLQTLSGTATITKTFVSKIKSTQSSVLDTRKTIPGLRIAQKYAVKIGGGLNQRLGLYDEVLIKENHIKSLGNIKNTLNEVKNNLKISDYQIEVENLKQLKLAINGGAKNILLDNFSINDTKRAVSINNGESSLEVSGNITINNILDYANTGVPRISVGALTKNIEAIDFSMIIGTI